MYAKLRDSSGVKSLRWWLGQAASNRTFSASLLTAGLTRYSITITLARLPQG